MTTPEKTLAAIDATFASSPVPPTSSDLAAAVLRALADAGGSWTDDELFDMADQLDGALLKGEARPALAPAGEVGELVALIRQIVLAWEPDACLLGNMTAGQFTRVADLLDELVQVAYAASDFICGTRFPEFANEHGGIDRLTADLCRLVAQFEYGPRPVPGVDVPGPDGDWGGLEELCKAEGVYLRIGVPLLQRAQEAWKNASQATPAPVVLTDAELEERFRAWWQQSYPTPPGPHAVMTHVSWARHLLELGKQRQS